MKLAEVITFKKFVLILAILFACQNIWILSVKAAEIHKISAIGYVTWWSHDAVGYHPAIWLKIENSSKFDLSKATVRMQARFTDLHSGFVTVARKEVHVEFVPHQRTCIMLRAPSTFELPIDENAWPTIECKVMCRVGDVGDEGTQDLIIAHLEQITMTDEDALSQLIKQTGVGNNFSNYAKTIANTNEGFKTKKKPNISQSTLDTADGVISHGSPKRMLPPSLPALGDDFYLFEKFFGVPSANNVVPNKEDMTWVNYPNKASFSNIFVGSRSLSGKADIIVTTLPGNVTFTEGDLLALAKQFSSHGKDKMFFVHTVRYLSYGRRETLKANGKGCKITSFKTPKLASGELTTILIVSRLSDDPENILTMYAKRVPMLGMFLPSLAIAQNQDAVPK